MAQYLIPGYGILNDASGSQYPLPGLGIINGSVSAPAAYSLSVGAGSFALSGMAVAFRVDSRIQADAGNITLSVGSAVGFTRAYRLAPEGGSFTVSGTAAGLARRAGLAAGSGVFTLSGIAVALRRDSKLAAGSGSISLTGQPATFPQGAKLTAEPGSVTLTGGPINPLITRYLQAGAAAVLVAGPSTTNLHRGYKLDPVVGTITITGSSLNMQHSLGSGSLLLQGQAVGLRHSWKLSASPGTITLTGQDIFLGPSSGLTAQPGVFLITGFPVAGFPRTYRLMTRFGNVILAGSDKTQFKYLPAPQIIIPSSGRQGPRGTGSSLSSRGTSSVSHRAQPVSLSQRNLGESIERRTAAVPIGATETQYIDRYVYVDGSMTTATVFEMPFSYGDATPQPIFSLLANAMIAEVNVWLLEPFNGIGAQINIGRSSNHDELMNDTEIDPTFLSSYSTRPGKEYNSGEHVNLYLNPGAGASQGRGVLSVYII